MTELVGLGGCEPSSTLPISAVSCRLVSSLVACFQIGSAQTFRISVRRGCCKILLCG